MTPAGVDRAVFGGWCDQACLWPLPGGGRTTERWALLTQLAFQDLVLARLVEAHADAVAITRELDGTPVRAGQRWAVWAAGPADSVTAAVDGGVWQISGTKAWCSGATLVTHALLDASGPAGQQLFAVDVTSPGVAHHEVTWVGPGMAAADTRRVSFDSVAATPIGRPGEYVDRPGFWAGAIGVAACWHGGTAHVAGALHERARVHANPHLLAHLGAVHVALNENAAVLAAAGAALDRGRVGDPSLLALPVRSTIERNAVEVMTRAGRALGPAPLAHDAQHAQLVADLSVYVRQHHAETDLEALGRLVAEGDGTWLQ